MIFTVALTGVFVICVVSHALILASGVRTTFYVPTTFRTDINKLSSFNISHVST
jgi:hypothetical protein